MNENHLNHVIDEVAAERYRQDQKWGEQNHDNLYWNAILGEEVGEAAQAVLHGTGDNGKMAPQGDSHLREELVQVAAVAVSWIQAIDRRGSV